MIKNPNSSLPRRLTENELSTFRHQGYLILHHVLPLAELQNLNDELEIRYKRRLKDSEIAQDEQKRNQIHGLGADSERSRQLASDPRILSLV